MREVFRSILFIAIALTVSCFGSYSSRAQCPSFTFSLPDSVCGGQNVNLTYNGPGGLDLFWNFDTGDLHNTPSSTNYGNLGAPGFPQDLQLIKANGAYHLFYVNFTSSTLRRYDFGNSLSNTPTTFNYGSVGNNLINPSGIELVNEGGIWYAIVVNYTNKKLIRVELGSNITSNTAAATDLGVISVEQPRSLKIITDNGDYFAFISNGGSTELTKVEFGNSITNTPSNVSVLSDPSFNINFGFDIAFDCNSGKFIGFMSSLSNNSFNIIDFGTSLTNTGTVTGSIPAPVGSPTGLSLVRDGKNWYIAAVSINFNKLMVVGLGEDLTNVTADTVFADTAGVLKLPAQLNIFSDSSRIYGFATNTGSPNSITKYEWPMSMNAIPAYDYGSTNTSFTPLTPGYFPVTLQGTDTGTGITNWYTDSIYVKPSPIPSFTTSPPCAGDSIQFTDLTSIQGGIITSWTWDFGDGSAVSNDQDPKHLYSGPGGYLVTLTVSSNNGCQNIYSDSLIVSAKPVADFTFNDNQCARLPVNFSDASIPGGTSSITSWSWDFGDGSPADSIQAPVHIYDTAGVYTVTLTVTIQNGCSDEISYPVTIIPSPVPDFTVSNTCVGHIAQFTNTTTIQGGVNVNYQWDFGDTNTSALVDPTHSYSGIASNYDVTLIANAVNGCTDTISRNIRIAEQPVPGFSYTPVTACAGNAVTFLNTSIGSGNDTISNHSWTFGDGGISSDKDPVYIYNTPGTYNIILTVTSPTACDSSATQQITIIPGPDCSFTSADDCEYNQIIFNPVTFTPPGTTVDSISWDFGDSTTFTGLSSPAHLYQQPGTYLVTMTIFNSVNCTDTYVDTVIVHPAPTASFNNSLPCSGSDIMFDGSISSGNGDIITSWLWDFNGTGTSSDTMPVFSFADSGSYNITLIVTTQNGCTDTLDTQISVVRSPDFDFIFADPCFGDPVTFTYVPNESPPPPANLLWNFGDNSTSSQLMPTYLYAQVDTFFVSLTVLNPNTGCSTILEKPLEVKPLPVTGFIASDVCQGSELQITDTTTIEYGSIVFWDWDFGNGSTDTVPDPVIIYNNAGDYDIELITTSDLGCSTSQMTTITVFEKPVASFVPDPLFGSPPLTVNFIDSSVGAAAYAWDFGDNTSGTGNAPTHVYTDTGNYTVTLIVESIDGCFDTTFNSLGVLIPFMDLAVREVSFTKTGNLVNLSALITNQGNITVNTFEISGFIDQNTPITEIWTGSFQPGQSISYKFDASFQVDPSFIPDYYCVSADNPNDGPDDRPENNRLCDVNKNTFEIIGVTPNPFNDLLSLALNLSQQGEYTVRVFDVAGKLVSERSVSGATAGFNLVEIPSVTFAEGIYSIYVEFNGQSKVMKAMKK